MAKEKRTYRLAKDTTYSGWWGDKDIQIKTDASGKFETSNEDEQAWLDANVVPNLASSAPADDGGEGA